MFNYLKIAWRSIRRNRLVAAINVGGIALSLAACLVIIQYVRFESSYDTFYPNAGDIYRLNTWYKEGEAETRYATTPPPLAAVVQEEIPEVAAVCRLFYWSDFTMRPDHDLTNVFRETNVYAASGDFFRVFQRGLLAGDTATALRAPQSVVLPVSAAIRYFGADAVRSGNIVGRRLLGGKDAGTPWTVTGLLADQPANSHLAFDFLISDSSYPDDLYRNTNWNWNVMHTYLRLQATNMRAQVAKKLHEVVRRHALPGMGLASGNFAADGNPMTFVLQPLTDIHLDSHLLREMQPNGSRAYVRIFTLVAFLILLIAGVNYVNLFTAQAFQRAREVGVKKIMGASREQLIRQFLVESFLICLVGMVLALALVEMGSSMGIGELEYRPYLDRGSLLASSSVLLVAFSLLAGLYPAFFLSVFQPAEAVQGKIGSGVKDVLIRNGLVVLQLVLSIGMLAGTFVVQGQLALIQHKNLGFDKGNVLVIENDREIDERMTEFKEELRRNPDIINASFSNGIPGLSTYQMREFQVEGSETEHAINWYQMDEDHLATLRMEVVSGRGFDPAVSSDSSGILLNEAAVKLLGLDRPIGQLLTKNPGQEDEEHLQVLGVVRDFNFESLRQSVKPLAIQYFKGFVFKDYISIRLAPKAPEEAIAFIEQTWKRFEPDVPIRYHFLDESYDRLYRIDRQLGRVMALFTGLAVFIACLGLFGVITYIVDRRTKEIAIRKVLGASVTQVVRLLSGSFLKLVVFAFSIAAPFAWWITGRWLREFVYRIDLKPGFFILAGIVTALITLLTILIRTIPAAQDNPVEGLRSE